MIDLSDIQTSLQDVEGKVQRVEQAVSAVERSVRGVEKAVKENRPSSFLATVFFVLFIIWCFEGAEYSRFRYCVENGLWFDKVIVGKRPHDCGLWTSPVGLKYCHYEPVVGKVYWARSTQGSALASYDEGKTWETFQPGPQDYVPTVKTLMAVVVSWEKKDDRSGRIKRHAATGVIHCSTMFRSSSSFIATSQLQRAQCISTYSQPEGSLTRSALSGT
jgi:hypothetical protein